MELLYLGYTGAWLYDNALPLWIVGLVIALMFVAREIRKV